MNNSYIDQVLATQKEWQELSNDDTAIKKMAFESLKKCSEAIRVLSET